MGCHCTGSHPGSSQRAPAFCTGCTAPASTCSVITHRVGQGFEIGKFSGLLKSCILGSSDKLFSSGVSSGRNLLFRVSFAHSKVWGSSCSKSSSKIDGSFLQSAFLGQNHFLELHFNATMKAKSICLQPSLLPLLMLEHECSALKVQEVSITKSLTCKTCSHLADGEGCCKGSLMG